MLELISSHSEINTLHSVTQNYNKKNIIQKLKWGINEEKLEACLSNTLVSLKANCGNTQGDNSDKNFYGVERDRLVSLMIFIRVWFSWKTGVCQSNSMAILEIRGLCTAQILQISKPAPGNHSCKLPVK